MLIRLPIWKKSKIRMLSLIDINARLASISTGIPKAQIDIDKIYTYLETLATHVIFPWLLPPSTLREVLEI